MALTPQNSEAFMREVDEAVRQDQLLTFWQRYGRWIVGLIVVALIAFGGWLYWQHHTRTRSQAVSEQMAKILDSAAGGSPDARALDALTKADQPGFAASAQLVKAGIAARSGDGKAAIPLYRAMASDEALDAPYRELALVRQTALEFDSLKPREIVDRLKPLAVEGSPWFGSAGEMVAIAYMKMRRPDLAGPVFAAMAKDKGVPATIRSRARQMAGLLGIDAVETPVEPGQG
ncbi:tetratricopeptide repeat protein [Sphingobium sp. AN641]|uniref:tetratricopeptide repeat protein n=1 Tax=Sphingobium sp. AN641 TaxID=3133443 RepID=UPI0030C28175